MIEARARTDAGLPVRCARRLDRFLMLEGSRRLGKWDLLQLWRTSLRLRPGFQARQQLGLPMTVFQILCSSNAEPCSVDTTSKRSQTLTAMKKTPPKATAPVRTG